MYTATNPLVLDNLEVGDLSILDVGCGTGTTAKQILKINPNATITGVNAEPRELNEAKKYLSKSILFDLNDKAELPITDKYDLIICSHVLEHLVLPGDRVAELSGHLKKDGRMILLVPNFAIWKARIKLLTGKFEYSDHGLYDRTHLRFYTWNTFAKEVVPPDMRVVDRLSSGNFPMPMIRTLLPNNIAEKIDKFMLKKLPNLFSSEVGLIIRRKET